MNDIKHDLNLIRVLVAIADTKRVARAARVLGMTQPGVSNALRRLRLAYADELFVRTVHGMEATPRAAPLIETGREILSLHASKMLHQVEFDCRSTDDEFRFAMSDIGEMVFLPSLRKRFAAKAPKAVLRSQSLAPAQLQEALEDGSVDLALGYFPDIRGANCFQQKLFSHSFACLARADHPLIGRRLSEGQFLSLPHAVVHTESRSQEMVENFLERRGVRRHVALRVSHYTSIPFVVANSELIVTVPLAVAVAFGTMAGIRVLKPPFDIPQFDIKHYWHRRVHHDPRSVWLRTQVNELFRGAAEEWKSL